MHTQKILCHDSKESSRGKIKKKTHKIERKYKGGVMKDKKNGDSEFKMKKDRKIILMRK